MTEINKPIGGEFWFQKEFKLDNKINTINDKLMYLNGGNSAIRFILRDIEMKDNSFIILPSYLCPSIIDIFEEEKVNFLFYKIKEDLTIDLDYLKNIVQKNRIIGIFFIDYFGFPHGKEIKEYLFNLKNKGIILIEDAVQRFWLDKCDDFIGDYVFNSLRKFLPIDGSLVICNKTGEYKEKITSYNEIIRRARSIKTKYILESKGCEIEILRLFENAEDEYYKNKEVLTMNKGDKAFIKKINITELINTRLENYNYLMGKLRGLHRINILKNITVDEKIIPISFPIAVEERDFFRSELKKQKIYCPIHWNIVTNKYLSSYDESVRLSKKIISIPIDWRYGIKEMDYLVEKIHGILMEK